MRRPWPSSLAPRSTLVRVIDPLHPGAPLANLLAGDALALEVWLEGERVAARSTSNICKEISNTANCTSLLTAWSGQRSMPCWRPPAR